MESFGASEKGLHWGTLTPYIDDNKKRVVFCVAQNFYPLILKKLGHEPIGFFLRGVMVKIPADGSKLT